MATYTEMGASIAARAFFYPSLLFNIARERLQEDWHWCDLVTEVGQRLHGTSLLSIVSWCA